ncbi:MAG: molybdopterin-guanine dinucleotide biosynthesis protein B [Dehalococcoidia bacterium]
MPPVVSIVGKSKSARTEVIGRLVHELKSRGYRVATLTHTPQANSFVRAGKNGWHHIEAGSEATVVSSAHSLVLVKAVCQATPLEEIVRVLGEDYDIILAEGFKRADTPKIEAHRKGGGTPMKNIKRIVATVTDEPLETRARQFSFADYERLADLLERGFIEPQKERISLYVNNAPVPLSLFPKQIITNVLLAMASCLKGVREITSLQVFLRKEHARQ